MVESDIGIDSYIVSMSNFAGLADEISLILELLEKGSRIHQGRVVLEVECVVCVT